jgi:hypothetical protein
MRRSEPPHKRYPFLTSLVLMLIIATILFLKPMGAVGHGLTNTYHWVSHFRWVEQMRADFSHHPGEK